MARFGRLCGLVLLLCGGAAAADNPFLPARDPAPLLAAIDKERPTFAVPGGVSGISVPHHLLAANLIARGFWAASAGHYKRVIVISPDHFRRLSKPFGTTAADLDTVFGTVAADREAIAGLEAEGDLVEALPDISHEHGVMAEAPFVRHFFPGARIVPVLASVNAVEADWQAMAKLLAPLADKDTLVVQSTDYSHYRPLAEAVVRDQESIAAIGSGDPGRVAPLLQPSHMDSLAAQYIQLMLQGSVYHAHPVVIGNRNSAEYGGATNNTTSYVVTAYVADPASGAALDYADQTRVMFAGDVLLGRYLTPVLRDPAGWGRVRDAALAATRGTPLIVNLEGVLLGEPVSGVSRDAHVMDIGDAAPVLAALGVRAASLANNHANDLGPAGRAESAAQLAALGITPLEHGELVDMGAFRLLALNFVGGKLVGEAIAGVDDLDFVCGLAAAPPLVAFVHWGTEYTVAGGAREDAIARKLRQCGVSLVVGAHSHQASTAIASLGGGQMQQVYSLGNFIFDQSAPRGSGSLLEVRVFAQGTVAARLVPVPNLFDLGRGAP